MKSWMSLFSLACLFGAAYATDFPEREPNDTWPPTSILGTLQSGDRVTGRISTSADEDYSFIKTKGTITPGWYRFRFQVTGLPQGGDSVLEVLDTNDSPYLLAYSDDPAPGVTPSDAKYDMWTNGSDIVWGLHIYGWDTVDIWNYQIVVTITPIAATDAGTFPAGLLTFTHTMTDGQLSLFTDTGGFIKDVPVVHTLSATLTEGDYWLCLSQFDSLFPMPEQDRTGVGLGEQAAGSYSIDVNGAQFNGSLAYSDAKWYKFHVTGSQKTIFGKVDLGGLMGTSAGVAMRFDLRQPGTQTILQTTQVPLDGSGNYQFLTGLSGMVDVAAFGPVWLRSVLPLNLNGTTTGVDFSLTGGDVDHDNKTDLLDITTVLLNWAGSGVGTTGDATWDGVVDLFDLSLTLVNFGQTGAP